MDLTTLTRLKAQISGGVGSLNNDSTLNALIMAASDAVEQYCSRQFKRNTVTNLVLNGTGTNRLTLPYQPVIALSGPIIIDGQTVQQVPTQTGGGPNVFADGFSYDTAMLYRFGGAYIRRGQQNVVIPSLTTGFTTQETGTIPAATSYTIIPRNGASVDTFGQPESTGGYAFADLGVTFTSNGVALVKVAGGPAAGQYNFTDGVYTFNSADASKGVLMKYDFVPASVEQAAVLTVSQFVSDAKNTGVKSVSIADERVTYSDMALPKSAQVLLSPYRWVVSP